MSERKKYCSENKKVYDLVSDKVDRVENRIPSDTVFCPFFRLWKKLIFRCRSPPFINFELKKFEVDRRK